MNSSKLLIGVACGTVIWAQATTTPSTAPQAPSPASPSASQLKARGPEAVAKQDPNRVVATIEGKPLTAKQAVDLLKPLSPEDRKRFESNLPALVQQAYMREQLAQEGAKLSLDQQSPWKEQIENARTGILAQAYLNRMTTGGGGTATADPKQFYDTHPEDFDQVKLSGIFVSFAPPGTPASKAPNARSEEQARDKANDLEKKLKTGAEFSAIARTDSEHHSSTQGGSLGTYALGDAQIPADLKAAILKLQPGQVSDPVRVPGALLIVKLDSRNKLSFDQAKPSIEQKMQTEKSQAILKQEFEKYKVQVQDPDFFNSTSNAAPIPTLQRPGSTTPQSTTTTPAPRPPAK
jgi:peptidyl-prolyl cis-trans isomerase C